ncbi:MAG: CDP-diacylglycerol--glycerol-3-phosphate 3-phosphatidyltransferase [Gloeomargarita sp. SKYBB_i_bin120]|nr:CDP-diacylglycerol--glycerol-3-phosphate 3-phosphatidyltransferase [Gloeomargarita sp. SKYG98]MCS7291349.1 CDP-diacylglycerol--glycerol-3-phosphate 3-phosphatidyltransferase [Gloeomargarita sp. SKYB120]MDW8176908.1 CDP-diacylglycerol--glycerol-3-phosphate 3-phosphatidyltransferase [Gloeomargarita sp. SKYBB_i_bin120]
MTTASWLTLSRLLVIPGVFVALAQEARDWAAGLFLLGAVTDALDGYVARRWRQVTDVGKWLDPLVDKLLVMAPLLALVESGDVPGWGVFLLLARELTITAWRAQLPQVVGADRWGKAKTVSQVGAVVALLLWPGLLSQTLFAVAVVITWLSGIMYLWPPKTS